MIGSVTTFVLGFDCGAFSMLGACLAILFGCIDVKQAIRGVEWNTVLVVVGTLGFAKGINASGAGEIIASNVLHASEGIGLSAFGIAVVILFLCTVLSNVMANNAVVAIGVPIALSIAAAMGANPIPFALACAVGANLSVMTPISTTTITVTVSAGYRFKDYVRFGGLFNLCAFLATAIVMKIIYF